MFPPKASVTRHRIRTGTSQVYALSCALPSADVEHCCSASGDGLSSDDLAPPGRSQALLTSDKLLWIFLDFETTGLDTNTDQITQVMSASPSFFVHVFLEIVRSARFLGWTAPRTTACRPSLLIPHPSSVSLKNIRDLFNV